MRCIIIDDDSVSLRILAEYIARTDFLVDAGQFATSIEAINFLHTNPDIDLIFLDVRLPEMDGFEFLDTFENPPQVIMVSASEEYALKAFDFGAIDYLLKPVAYARFYKAVQRALKSMNPISAEGRAFPQEELIAGSRALFFHLLGRIYGELREYLCRAREVHAALYPESRRGALAAWGIPAHTSLLHREYYEDREYRG